MKRGKGFYSVGLQYRKFLGVDKTKYSGHLLPLVQKAYAEVHK